MEMGVLQFTDEAARQLQAIYTTPDIIAQRRAALDHAHDARCTRLACVGLLSRIEAHAFDPTSRLRLLEGDAGRLGPSL